MFGHAEFSRRLATLVRAFFSRARLRNVDLGTDHSAHPVGAATDSICFLLVRLLHFYLRRHCHCAPRRPCDAQTRSSGARQAIAEDAGGIRSRIQRGRQSVATSFFTRHGRAPTLPRSMKTFKIAALAGDGIGPEV